MRLAFLLFVCFSVVIAGLPHECGQLTPPHIPSIDTQGYTLEQVTLLFRHGDRIMYQDRTCWPNDKAVYECQNRHLSIPSYYENQTETNSDRVYRLKYLPNRNYYAGNCETGQLTNRGFNQEFAVGKMYRRAYIDTGFLKTTFDPDVTYLRSDHDDRCVQSLEAMLEGMYPKNKDATSVAIYDINTMDSHYDNISPNSNICPLWSNYSHAAYHTPEYQTFYQTHIVPLYQNLSKVLGFNVDSKDDVNQIHDCLVVHACHEQPIPSGAEYGTTLYTQVMEAFEFSSYSVYTYPTPQLNAQAGIGYLLQEITQQMQDKMQGNNNYKLLMYSGHDTSLIPILVAFNEWKGIWAMYASQIQFELYKNSTGDRKIRIAYNGRNLIPPGCNSALCDWNDYYNFVSTLFPPGNNGCPLAPGSPYTTL